MPTILSMDSPMACSMEDMELIKHVIDRLVREGHKEESGALYRMLGVLKWTHEELHDVAKRVEQIEYDMRFIAAHSPKNGRSHE